MGHFSLRHTFDCDVDTFWKEIFRNRDFNLDLYLNKLQFDTYDVENEHEDDQGRFHRRVKITPRAKAPAMIQKALGEKFSYTEDGVWEPSDGKYHFRIIPSTMSEKSTIQGTLWAEPESDGKCVRCCEMEITVRVFGVGKVIESFVEKTTRDSYEVAATETQRWLRDKGMVS